MQYIDVNCLLGHWPFRKLYRNTYADLAEIHRENGIGSGLVSSLNAIFYNDPFEGDEELYQIIKGGGYRHIMTVNPMLPGFTEDIRRGMELFGISGVKIFPGYHNYSLDSKQVRLLCEFLMKNKLPLLLALRLEDERLDYLIKPSPVKPQDIRLFIEDFREMAILLLNIRYDEIISLKSAILNSGNVYFDTSGLKDRLFNIEKLVESLGDDKIIYGSQYPLNCLKSTLFEVTKAEIGRASAEKILSLNVKKIF